MMREYYADYDEETALYCVFDTEQGKAHASYATMRQAEAKAAELNCNAEEVSA